MMGRIKSRDHMNEFELFMDDQIDLHYKEMTESGYHSSYDPYCHTYIYREMFDKMKLKEKLDNRIEILKEIKDGK